MPEGIGYESDGSPKKNPGKGAALGLLSEKLVTGIGNRRKKRRAGRQQQTLSQQSLPQKKSPLEASSDANRSSQQSEPTGQSQNPNLNAIIRRQGSQNKIASSLK